VKPTTRRPVTRSDREKPMSRRWSQRRRRKPKSTTFVTRKNAAFSGRPTRVSPRTTAGTARRKQ